MGWWCGRRKGPGLRDKEQRAQGPGHRAQGRRFGVASQWRTDERCASHLGRQRALQVSSSLPTDADADAGSIMAESNESRWHRFVKEVAEHGIVWAVEKDGGYVTSKTRHGTNAFPWWSLKSRALRQIQVVPAYREFQPIGFEWSVFVQEWLPSLRASRCLIGVNYSGPNNVGFDLPIEEVSNAVNRAMSASRQLARMTQRTHSRLSNLAVCPATAPDARSVAMPARRRRSSFLRAD